jgi:hypothetical protein
MYISILLFIENEKLFEQTEESLPYQGRPPKQPADPSELQSFAHFYSFKTKSQ